MYSNLAYNLINVLLFTYFSASLIRNTYQFKQVRQTNFTHKEKSFCVGISAIFAKATEDQVLQISKFI